MRAEATLSALISLEEKALSSPLSSHTSSHLSINDLHERWEAHTGAQLPPKLLAPLTRLYCGECSPQEEPQEEVQEEAQRASRAALWGALTPRLERLLRPSLLDALSPITPRDQLASLASELKGYDELLRASLRSGRPFVLDDDPREGLAFERFVCVALTCPSELLCEASPLYTKLHNAHPCAPLTATLAPLAEDLLRGRDVSVSRLASAQHGVVKARAWLQVSLVSEAQGAEAKARAARRRGNAHCLTPHHLALACPPEHPLWTTQSHTPTTLQGRAYAIRALLVSASEELERLSTQASSAADLKPERLQALLTPLMKTPALTWQLKLSAHSMLDRPLKGI